MSDPNPNSLPALRQDHALQVVLLAADHARELAREAVRPADLTEVMSEAWMNGALRQGYPRLPLNELPVVLVPKRQTDTSPCEGFALEVRLPNGATHRSEFSILCLTPVAARASAELVAAGALQAGQKFHFQVEANGAPVLEAKAASAVFSNVKITRPPLAYLEVPLRPMLEQSEPVAILYDAEFPVFYTAAALAQAEACARKGGAFDKPVETGCLLVGSLAACPQTGEFYPIVTDVLEVLDAEQTAFSLSYTSRSWLRLSTIMRARQAAHPGWATRILGQGHGHNFAPGDGKRCATCDKVAFCDLSSVFISQEDQIWHGCVFARQPWALCHIFGLTARNEPVQQLHALKDGRLQARGYYVLPQFNPESWPAKNLP